MTGWIGATAASRPLRQPPLLPADDTMSLKDKSCIVGLGETAFTRGAVRPVIDLVTEASLKAIENAGLKRSDIDGFVMTSSRYIFQEALQVHLGIEDLRYAAIVEMGGASSV